MRRTIRSGNLYVADNQGERTSIVFKITPAGAISMFAGTGVSGFTGDGGPATSARLNAPAGIAIDSSNNVYIADTNNARIRKVSAATGFITTIAGEGFATFSGDGGPATGANLRGPRSMVFDAAGNLYIADTSNNRIRRIDPLGNISTFAGTGTGSFSGDNGVAASATLNAPQGIAIDSAGNLYIADTANHRIRR